ncbi:MAG: hypothetical protein EBZ77_07850, partial [Chitinophagia bacterium]|nr:hypothetical protein [Chitinophagia bacterium]
TYFGDGGAATAAGIQSPPVGIAIDKYGNIYFAERFSNRVRKISSLGIITSFAGTGIAGDTGDGGPASAAQLNSPFDIAIDTENNIFISEIDGARIRKIAASTGIITTYAGTGYYTNNGDGGPATSASFHGAIALCIDHNQNIYVMTGGNQLRKIDRITEIITTVAGGDTSVGYSGDGGTATNAKFNQPSGLCIDKQNNLYISDFANARIRMVNAISGIITTVAGCDSGFYNGEGLPATDAHIMPFDAIFDNDGNLIIGERYNYRLRKLSALDNRIYTIAGTGTRGFSGDGSRSDSAEISVVQGVTVDDCNNIYFSDGFNFRIRKITYPGNNQPSITVTAQGGTTLCYPMPTTFTAHTQRVGRSPVYQWRVNGRPVGSGRPGPVLIEIASLPATSTASPSPAIPARPCI